MKFAIFAFLTVIGWVSLQVYLFFPGHTCLRGMVSQVGACDTNGKCRTILSNGVDGLSEYPIVGRPANVCFEKE
jgi:hypothetical protein